MRNFFKFVAAAAAVVVGLAPVAAMAQAAPKVTITAPKNGADVQGSSVTVTVKVENLKLVDAGTPVKAGEGHVHLIVDKDIPKAGDVVPSSEGYTHLGKAPYDTRALELTPGAHTITAVLADASHKVLDPVASAAVKVNVKGAAQAPPTKPANTGDGSLADEGSPFGLMAFAAMLLAGLALATRVVTRRS